MESSRESDHPLLGIVALDIDQQEKQAVIETLVQRMADRKLIADPLRVLAAILHREGEASTALSTGAAVPHARLKDFERIQFAFARQKKAIDWDGSPVEFVFLVCVPSSQSIAYLAFVQRLTRAFRDPVAVSALRNAPNVRACQAWLKQHLKAE